MKKTAFCLFVSTFFAAQIMAQPTFTTADMPDIGDQDTVLIKSGYTTTADFDIETGNGYTWDFSAIAFNPNLFDLDVYRVKTHAVSMQSAFADATLENYKTGVSAENVALFSYSNDTLLMHRRGGITQGQNFVPPVAILKFPLSYNQTSDLTSPTHIGTLVTGEKRTRVTYDGFGTLILPGNLTHTNVFRVKQVEEDTSYVLNNFTSVTTYIWYKQGGAVPLLKMIYSGIPAFYTAIASRSTGIGTNINELEEFSRISVFPNPVTSELTVKLDTDDYVDKIIIYDLVGKVIKSYHDGDMKINTDGLSAGTYFLRVSTSKHSYSGTFIKQ